MAITDLTGTKWQFNDAITLEEFGTMHIEGTLTDNNHTDVAFHLIEWYPTSLEFYSWVVGRITQYIDGAWENGAPTIRISGGDDVTNAADIAAFEANATQIIDPPTPSSDYKFLDDTGLARAFTNLKDYIDTADQNLQFQIDGLGEPFRLQDFTQQINVTIPSITTDVANTSIPNVDIDLDVIDPTGALNQNFAIAGLVKYEVFDATSGGNRLNVTPICSFSMNSQRTLRVRMMCAGASSKTARRIAGALLLKHR